MRQATTTAVAAMLIVGLGTTRSWGTELIPGKVDPQKEAARESAAVRATLLAAVALLPRHPGRIAVIDATQCRPGVRDYILTLDAFRVLHNDVIYVVQQSDLLRRARTARGIYIHMLAAVIWHEMAHLEGADERGARTAEKDLWTSFVRDGVVDQMLGLRYLQALNDRPEDQLPSL
jgi:hypothetical protein